MCSSFIAKAAEGFDTIPQNQHEKTEEKISLRTLPIYLCLMADSQSPLGIRVVRPSRWKVYALIELVNKHLRVRAWAPGGDARSMAALKVNPCVSINSL